MFKLLRTALFLLIAPLSMAEITVDVNSGNPTFPFPQFNSYRYSNAHSLGNLGTTMPEGVSHAEMELWIREAWQTMANDFEYTGVELNGVKYIKGNIGCPYDCSEGDGYALLAAVYLADKTTFDGLWFRTHDLRRAKKANYATGEIIRHNYAYGENALTEPGSNTASDGSFDIALSLLLAWKQWGEYSGHYDAQGNEISYRTEALEVIDGLVAQQNQQFGDCRSVSGSIGFDGYVKGGDTWSETTGWASLKNTCPEFQGPQAMHIDYMAPSYFRQFRKIIEEESGHSPSEEETWAISQLHRAEASSDWIMGKMFDKGQIPIAGWVSVNDDGSQVSFENFNDAEDFRTGWRTILNQVWHGNPDFSWDPVTHQVVQTPNTHEQDIASRFASFLKDPTAAPWSNDCFNADLFNYKGVPALVPQYTPEGEQISSFAKNWIIGTGSPAAVAAQDYELMGDLFREAVIEWDQYKANTPRYFDGFFRLVAMLTLTGNWQSPSATIPSANLKIYKNVDKTVVAVDEPVEVTLSYRNYGSVAAQNTVIEEVIPEGFTALNINNQGVVNGNKVIWNIPSVPGYNGNNVEQTQGEITFTLVPSSKSHGRYCGQARISASNAPVYTASEYPNNITTTMERNCIDVIQPSVEISKAANKTIVQPREEIEFTTTITNKNEGGLLNGGRSDVMVSVAFEDNQSLGNTLGMKVRILHGADEPYINFENYRVSYFVNDNVFNNLDDNAGWRYRSQIYEGGDENDFQKSVESIPAGMDAQGKWNQRFTFQFADQEVTTALYLYKYYGTNRIRRGGQMSLRAVFDMYTSNYSHVDWSDDWSYNASLTSADGDNYYPVSPSWTNPQNPNIENYSWHPDACEEATKNIQNILVEEWDGYTWRRIYGNAPITGGSSINNVVVTDTLPEGFDFVRFTNEDALNGVVYYDPATRVIHYSTTKILSGSTEEIAYIITPSPAHFNCPVMDQVFTSRSHLTHNQGGVQTATTEITTVCYIDDFENGIDVSCQETSYEVGDTITFDIDFVSQIGTIELSPTLNNGSDWTEVSGTWSFGDSLKNASTNFHTEILENKTSFKNGDIVAELQLSSYATFGIAFRNPDFTSNNGQYITFKANEAAESIEVSYWNGTKKEHEQQVPYAGKTTSIKISLDNDQAKVWIGTTTGDPTLILTDIPVLEGYAGFINGTPTGQDAWEKHSVSAFSLKTGDTYTIDGLLPEGVSFIDASNGGSLDNNKVQWPSSPLIAQEHYLVSWRGVVNECLSDELTLKATAKTNDAVYSDSTIVECISLLTEIIDQHMKTAVYPNPFDEQLTIQATSNSKFIIYSSTGEFIKEGELDQGQNEINMSSLNAGLYLLKINGEFKHIIKH